MNHALTMPRKFQRGFTLIELLASMILFSMIIGMTAWAVIGATDTTAGAEKQMDTTSQARAFLDRFGSDLNNIMDEGGLTALYYSNASDAAGNSAIGFVCRSRPRVASADSRGAVVGYRINDTTDLSGNYPMISRGDAELRYGSNMKSIMLRKTFLMEGCLRAVFSTGKCLAPASSAFTSVFCSTRAKSSRRRRTTRQRPRFFRMGLALAPVSSFPFVLRIPQREIMSWAWSPALRCSTLVRGIKHSKATPHLQASLKDRPPAALTAIRLP
jgi:prepilin-type N-terminal cleavage/methylation domain-containing protein